MGPGVLTPTILPYSPATSFTHIPGKNHARMENLTDDAIASLNVTKFRPSNTANPPKLF